MASAETRAAARRLREMGWTYRRIATHFDVTLATATRWCDDDARLRYNARKRERHRRDAVPCPDCGGPMSAHNKSKLCALCERRHRSEALMERNWQIVAWWGEGLTIPQIAKRLGWTNGHVRVEMAKLRSKGYSLPYRYNQPQRPPGVSAGGPGTGRGAADADGGRPPLEGPNWEA